MPSGVLLEHVQPTLDLLDMVGLHMPGRQEAAGCSATFLHEGH